MLDMIFNSENDGLIINILCMYYDVPFIFITHNKKHTMK